MRSGLLNVRRCGPDALQATVRRRCRATPTSGDHAPHGYARAPPVSAHDRCMSWLADDRQAAETVWNVTAGDGIMKRAVDPAFTHEELRPARSCVEPPSERAPTEGWATLLLSGTDEEQTGTTTKCFLLLLTQQWSTDLLCTYRGSIDLGEKGV